MDVGRHSAGRSTTINMGRRNRGILGRKDTLAWDIGSHGMNDGELYRNSQHWRGNWYYCVCYASFRWKYRKFRQIMRNRPNHCCDDIQSKGVIHSCAKIGRCTKIVAISTNGKNNVLRCGKVWFRYVFVFCHISSALQKLLLSMQPITILSDGLIYSR